MNEILIDKKTFSKAGTLMFIMLAKHVIMNDLVIEYLNEVVIFTDC
jgi:hypothetical protein